MSKIFCFTLVIVTATSCASQRSLLPQETIPYGGETAVISNDGPFAARLILLDIRETKRGKWLEIPSLMEKAEVKCQYYAYIIKNSYDLIWLPVWIKWGSETVLANFQPSFGVVSRGCWIPAVDFVSPKRETIGLTLVRLGKNSRLRPGTYSVVDMPKDAPAAFGAIAFPRQLLSSPADIECFLFRAHGKLTRADGQIFADSLRLLQ